MLYPLFLILNNNSGILLAQEEDINDKRTDSLTFFHTDTDVVPLGYPLDEKLSTPGNPDEYNSDDTKSTENWMKFWRNELIKMISVNDKDSLKRMYYSTESFNNYQLYSGKIIRSINFSQLEVFGQSFVDTSLFPTKWIERLGNGLHVHTQKYVLNNRLLIESGDTVNPYIIADNERILRELPYIEDVIVFIKETGPNSDSVDILFVTKDVLPFGMSFEVFDVSYGTSEIWNKNLMGLGHEVSYRIIWDYSKMPRYGHRLRYNIHSIGNTFFSASATYENQWKLEAYKLYINRNFLTPEIKYAGGIGFEKINLIEDIVLPDDTIPDFSSSYNFYDIWVGRSVHLRKFQSNRKRTNIAITGRISKYFFLKRPEIGESLLYKYHERTTILGSIGFSNQGFKKSQLIYGFGRFEDIPYGSLLTITAGYEINEFNVRPYIGMNYSLGKYRSDYGFLYNKIEFGTFLNNKIEQGVLKVRIEYFSPLIRPGNRYKYRIFTKLNYVSGFNRYKEEYIELNGDEDVFGLDSPVLKGNQKFTLNVENVCYSPHKVMGFKFKYYLFFDAGMIANISKVLLYNPVYSGFGAGMQIRNENLVFNTVQLRFVYYPLLPEGAEVNFIQLEGRTVYKPPNFIIPKPDVPVYQKY